MRGSPKKTYIGGGGGSPKKGGLGKFPNLRGGLAKKEVWVFIGRVDTLMHTMVLF